MLPVGPHAYVSPSLSPDGRRLAVQIDDGAERDILAAGRGRQAVAGAGCPRGRYRFDPPGYDVSPDGQRLLIVEQADTESAPQPIHVVLNWINELKARVPSR